MHFLVLLAACLLLISDVKAVSVLGFALIGGRSHQHCVLRIGQELAARGHNFTLLVSDKENLTVEKLGSKAFPGLIVVQFAGPPGLGSFEWFQALSRDTKKVRQAHMQACSSISSTRRQSEVWQHVCMN